MKQHGFSLVELIVVMAIIGILLSIATMQFNTYSKKSGIETQVKTIFTDLMRVRSQAMFQRRAQTVKFTTTQFSIYSSTVDTVNPVSQRKLNYPMKSGTVPTISLNFDTSGLLTGIANGSVCVDTGAENPADIDSIVVFTTRIQLGKFKQPGGACVSGNITTK